MKLCMLPNSSELGIGRVVSAYRQHLPDFGIEFVDSENDADVISVHAGCQSKRQPDVTHNHGLYPTATVDSSGKGYFDMNADVISNVRKSRIITVASEWIADVFRRDMLISPVVLPHGINLEEWQYSPDHSGYALWAKGHTPGVCDPGPMNLLAEKLPKIPFISTFGNPTSNVKIVGRLSFDRMKKAISQAGFYLALVKEGFGIQTLEAMACGVPVVGYDHGGTSDIITHGYDGWLAEPGDVDNLAKGVDWVLRNRAVLGKRCRATAEKYSWELICEELAALYNSLHSTIMHEDTDSDKPDVSVVISCYNYARFVDQAIESALAQKFDGLVEIIVVNDGSTDGSENVITEYIKQGVKLINIPNSGVANARNIGILHAKAEIIANLDADDTMLPNFLVALYPTIADNRNVGISYGKLILDADGRKRSKGTWPEDFTYTMQATGQNRVPSACLFRKSAWERAGGYRGEYTPAEDAELWLRIASVGFDAVKATDEAVYVYRMHPNSLSRRRKEPDYVGDKGWSSDLDNTPFAAPASGYKMASFPFRNYDDSWVSVIIPVGSGHEELVHRAVDSVWRQDFPYWECVVVNDSGKELRVPSTGRLLKEAYPFIKVIETEKSGSGPGLARNLGVLASKSELVVFLDADDSLIVDFLSSCIRVYNEDPNQYVYTDWYNENGKRSTAQEYDCARLMQEAIHPVTALIPKAWHLEVGGFDVDLEGWEDWDYTLRLAQKGHCGIRVAEPLVLYDYGSGLRREYSLTLKEKLLMTIRGRYKRSNMACTNCKNKRSGVRTPTRARSQTRSAVPGSGGNNMLADGKVKVKENSGNRGSHTVIGASTRINYGRKNHGQEFPMHVQDQQAQPHLYVLVVTEVKKDMPTRPTPPPAPKQVEVVEHVIADEVIEQVFAELTQEPDDSKDEEFDLDISLLKLGQVKELGLSPEEADALYEEEAQGKGRKTVLAYLDDLRDELYEDEEEYVEAVA